MQYIQTDTHVYTMNRHRHLLCTYVLRLVCYLRAHTHAHTHAHVQALSDSTHLIALISLHPPLRSPLSLVPTGIVHHEITPTPTHPHQHSYSNTNPRPPLEGSTKMRTRHQVRLWASDSDRQEHLKVLLQIAHYWVNIMKLYPSKVSHATSLNSSEQITSKT